AGSPTEVIAEITDQPTNFTPIGPRSSTRMMQTIVSDFANGEAINLATKNRGTADNIVNDHSYAMIGYDAEAQTITLYNPWGVDNGTSFPGVVTLTWSEVVHSFSEWEVGAVAPSPE